MEEMQKGTQHSDSETQQQYQVIPQSAEHLFLGAAKVSKGKHRGKNQEKEETESAAEPEAEPGNHDRL